MGGLHDCGLVEDIKMVFFDKDEFADKLSMVHRFIEKIVSRNKTEVFEFTQLRHYSIEYAEAWKNCKTIWGDTFRIDWKLDHNVWPRGSTILAVQMRLSTDCTPSSWFEDLGGAAFVGNPGQSKLSLGDVAKMSGCALDITCHFSYSGAPTSSQREIYMPDGSKVFSEETEYDCIDYRYKMHNTDFGKTSFISIIEDNRFEESVIRLALNGEVQDEAQQS